MRIQRCVQKEASLLAQGIKLRTNCGQQLLLFGTQQDADYTHWCKTEELRSKPSGAFVQEHQVSLHLKRQRNGLRLASIEVKAQCIKYKTFAGALYVDP